jgi:hypothetical protein
MQQRWQEHTLCTLQNVFHLTQGLCELFGLFVGQLRSRHAQGPQPYFAPSQLHQVHRVSRSVLWPAWANRRYWCEDDGQIETTFSGCVELFRALSQLKCLQWRVELKGLASAAFLQGEVEVEVENIEHAKVRESV